VVAGVGQLGILGSRGWLPAWINWEFWVAVGCDWIRCGWLVAVGFDVKKND
jgi:hypothetical protein